MNPTLIRIDNHHPDLLESARLIRRQVFVEEQHVPADLEYDMYESSSSHYLLLFDDQPVATCRWRYTSAGIKLERFAVLPQYRGKGFGEFMVRKLLAEVIPEGKHIYLHAQEQVTGFYEKLGFCIVGRPFTEAGIRHFRMVYDFASTQQAAPPKSLH